MINLFSQLLHRRRCEVAGAEAGVGVTHPTALTDFATLGIIRGVLGAPRETGTGLALLGGMNLITGHIDMTAPPAARHVEGIHAVLNVLCMTTGKL